MILKYLRLRLSDSVVLAQTDRQDPSGNERRPFILQSRKRASIALRCFQFAVSLPSTCRTCRAPRFAADSLTSIKAAAYSKRPLSPPVRITPLRAEDT